MKKIFIFSSVVFIILLVLWIIYIGSFSHLSFFSLYYRFQSLFATSQKIDQLNSQSIERAKETKTNVTILLHGAVSDYKDLYGAAIWLKKQGFNPVIFNYSYKDSPYLITKNFNSYVSAILNTTQTKKVNIVGMCVGGIVGEYYAKKFDGSKNIDKMVTILTPLIAIPSTDVWYIIDKTFFFDPAPWNETLTFLNETDSVEKTLHIYSKNDFIINTKYQLWEGKKNFVNVDIWHSPMENSDFDVLSQVKSFINSK